MRWLLEGPWRASLRRKDWWVKVLRLTSFHEQPLLKLLSRTRRRGKCRMSATTIHLLRQC